ncbi:hypothetical protein TRFO_10320 [Tritrichomonas foetus]|uniref:Uncharacterized protein n=1 Tax=Tritrichomonas foetus TaxID=1144522 RepID=A0A1J4J927_9EUKA|nr:hypothetical protein TRFO_10320 [Tritrichomonas foetus]|eukprot:OHS95690.1 hypothetical protein TRFO_10320 [Tritrichomonas foetus]
MSKCSQKYCQAVKIPMAVSLLAAALLQVFNLDIFFSLESKKDLICENYQGIWSSSTLPFSPTKTSDYLDREMYRLFSQNNGIGKAQSERIYQNYDDFNKKKPWDDSNEPDWSSSFLNYVFDPSIQQFSAFLTSFKPNEKGAVVAINSKGNIQSISKKHIFLSFFAINKSNIITSVESSNVEKVGQESLIDAISYAISLTFSNMNQDLQSMFGPVAVEAKVAINEGFIPYGFSEAFDKEAILEQLQKVIDGDISTLFNIITFSEKKQQYCK